MKTSVYRKERFNAAHRLHNTDWSDEKNLEIFGKCNNQYFHGHNYDLTVKLTGEVDPLTGYVYDMKLLKDLIKKHIVKRFDHKNLNLDVPDFKNLNPTSENLARIIWEILRKEIPENLELKIILNETEKNYVEYPG